MKDKLRRIDPLLKRSEERKQAAAREFAAKMRLLAGHEQRLGDLLRYADEYAQLPVGNSLAPAQLANREAFRAKLSDAVVTQRGQIETAKSHAELERIRYTRASRDSQVVEKLAASYREEIVRNELKQEQKSLDEFATGAHQRRTPPSENTP